MKKSKLFIAGAIFISTASFAQSNADAKLALKSTTNAEASSPAGPTTTATTITVQSEGQIGKNKSVQAFSNVKSEGREDIEILKAQQKDELKTLRSDIKQEVSAGREQIVALKANADQEAKLAASGAKLETEVSAVNSVKAVETIPVTAGKAAVAVRSTAKTARVVKPKVASQRIGLGLRTGLRAQVL